MELKQLKHFLAVIDGGGISAAARGLRLTQPALSRQIKALEEELGVVLLDRGARSFTPTPAAEALAADARKLLEFCEAMTSRVRAAACGLPLRIGYSPSLASHFLPPAIERFNQLHPRVRISLHDMSSLDMQQALLAGKVDVIVTVPCGGSEAIQWTTLSECGWRLAVGSRHRLANASLVTPHDLDGERMLMYERDGYPDYWARVTGYFKTHRIQAKVAGEFDGITSLAAAIEANLGCAIVADSTRLPTGSDQAIRSLPLDPKPEPLVICAGLSTRMPPAAHVLAFVEEMKL